MNVEKLYEKELKALGNKIKGLRKDLQLTQLDLELKTGIQRTDISRIENGTKNIEFFTIVRLASALKVNIRDLFDS